MSDRTERTRRDRITIDMKKIKEKVRKQGFRDTRVHDSIQEKSKYPHREIMDSLDSYYDEEND